MERRRSSRRRPKQPFAQRAKEHCRQFTAFMFSNVGIIILVVIYMIGGEWFIRPLKLQCLCMLCDLQTAVSQYVFHFIFLSSVEWNIFFINCCG